VKMMYIYYYITPSQEDISGSTPGSDTLSGEKNNFCLCEISKYMFLDTIFDMMKNLRKERARKIVETLVFIKPGYQLERVV